MSVRRRTISILWIIIQIIIPLLLIWDIYALYAEANATFSVVITDWYYMNPLKSACSLVMIGILIGHFFVPARGTKDD